MPSLSHGTLKSSPDENGNQHRLSIDALSSKKCTCVTRYKAQVYSYSKTHDPRDRNLVIVKFHRQDNSRAWAENELRIADFTRAVADKFNEYVRQTMSAAHGTRDMHETELRIVKPQMASLASTSIADRKRKKGDCLIFEDILENFTTFMNVEGESISSSRRRSRSSRQEPISFSQERTRSRPIPIPVDRRRCEPTAPPCDTDTDSPPSYEESERRELERMLSVYLKASVHSQNNRSFDQFSMDAQAMAAEVVDSIEQRLAGIRLQSALACGTGDRSTNNHIIEDSEFDDSDVANPLLQSFVHFFFCQTRGQAIVCGLKGSREEEGYTLTTPVLHSLCRVFGHRDEGEPAMREVIANHRCSKLCRHLPDMVTVLRNADRQNR